MEKVSESMNLLYDNLSALDGKECLIIADLYHSAPDEQSMNNQLDEINTFSKFDRKILYLIFSKDYNLKERNLNENVFTEDRLAYVHFLVGFALAKQLTIYIFTSELNTNWLKLNDSKYQNFLKFSEFEYLKITLEYMLREKKRNYEKELGKQPSKLTLLLNNKTIEKKESKQIESSRVICIRESFAFQNLFETVKKYLIKSNPKSFSAIRNTLINYSEQKIKAFDGFDENGLAFLLLTELLEKEVIINPILYDAISHNLVNKFEDILSLISFDIDTDLDIDSGSSGVKHKRNRSKTIDQVFTLSEKSEEEYRSLLQNSMTICNFVKSIITKILNSISLSTIDRMPCNPVKYKNYIYSHLNNQELRHIAKRILILDYDSLLNTLTEGIIIELMKNNLVIILSDSKMFYNLVKIEQEKYRLANK
jgi:hypothetical protein